MTMKRCSKIIAWVLTLIMVINMMPLSALANEGDFDPPAFNPGGSFWKETPDATHYVVRHKVLDNNGETDTSLSYEQKKEYFKNWSEDPDLHYHEQPDQEIRNQGYIPDSYDKQ